MTSTEVPRTTNVAPLLMDEGPSGKRVGTVIMVAALLAALIGFLIVAGLTPIAPTNVVVLAILVTNGVLVICLGIVVVIEGREVLRARRARAAAAGLHMRFMGWFAGIAALPALFIALVTSITLERSLDPWFRADLRVLLGNTVEIAHSYEEGQCRTMARELNLMAGDINSAKVMFDQNRTLFHDWFATRSLFLGFPVAMMLKNDGSTIETVQHVAVPGIALPRSEDYAEASDTEPFCFVPRAGGAFAALVKLSAFDDAFLFVARPGDPRANQYTVAAEEGLRYYQGLEGKRVGVQIAFASMYLLVTLILLLSAIRLGLSFANWLVLPIRRLIHATDQVAAGNFYVQVPTRKGESDLAHLSATFNGMTQELRAQHDRLVATSDMMDKRRRFTEAVLAGVSSGVIGIDAKGAITVLNPSAEKLLPRGEKSTPPLGARLDDLLPSVDPLVAEAREGRHRLVQGQISLARGTGERQVSVRVTKETAGDAAEGYVITLDDITDLVSAQRSAAWADVARRIAHEIKNPLTPIQLSAERLKRKYGRFITSDREVFDQCTNTIIRQVDDIKRMVDEFSSFARTPKPVLEESEVTDVAKHVIFLMQVARPDIDFVVDVPDTPLKARFDHRLIGQALTNIVKNATEAMEAKAGGERGKVIVTVTKSKDEIINIDVRDTGRGFPKSERQKLLEPYTTTRKEGTGLGLAIVGRILEEHGGGIELLDHLDAQGNQIGAWVRLWFPANFESETSAISHEVVQPMPKASTLETASVENEPEGLS
ncbi:MAG: PAS domain-containing sensor histidine kinase [Hyphomicrobiales bacterium]|nr:PAS domain-containing sensor histidine kinase [Hyphomicrobiales bacterium]